MSLLCLKFSARRVYMLDQEEEKVGEKEEGEVARAATLQQQGRRSCPPGLQ